MNSSQAQYWLWAKIIPSDAREQTQLSVTVNIKPVSKNKPTTLN